MCLKKSIFRGILKNALENLSFKALSDSALEDFSLHDALPISPSYLSNLDSLPGIDLMFRFDFAQVFDTLMMFRCWCTTGCWSYL